MYEGRIPQQSLRNPELTNHSKKHKLSTTMPQAGHETSHDPHKPESISATKALRPEEKRKQYGVS